MNAALLSLRAWAKDSIDPPCLHTHTHTHSGQTGQRDGPRNASIIEGPIRKGRSERPRGL